MKQEKLVIYVQVADTVNITYLCAMIRNEILSGLLGKVKSNLIRIGDVLPIEEDE